MNKIQIQCTEEQLDAIVHSIRKEYWSSKILQEIFGFDYENSPCNHYNHFIKSCFERTDSSEMNYCESCGYDKTTKKFRTGFRTGTANTAEESLLWTIGIILDCMRQSAEGKDFIALARDIPIMQSTLNALSYLCQKYISTEDAEKE